MQTTTQKSARKAKRDAKAAAKANAAAIETENDTTESEAVIATVPSDPVISAARLAKSATVTADMLYPFATASDRDSVYLMQYRDAALLSEPHNVFTIADCVSLAVKHPAFPKRLRNHRADVALIPSAPVADAACRERAIKAGNVTDNGNGSYTFTANGLVLADAAIAKAAKSVKSAKAETAKSAEAS